MFNRQFLVLILFFNVDNFLLERKTTCFELEYFSKQFSSKLIKLLNYNIKLTWSSPENSFV